MLILLYSAMYGKVLNWFHQLDICQHLEHTQPNVYQLMLLNMPIACQPDIAVNVIGFGSAISILNPGTSIG